MASLWDIFQVKGDIFQVDRVFQIFYATNAVMKTLSGELQGLFISYMSKSYMPFHVSSHFCVATISILPHGANEILLIPFIYF